MTGLENFVSCDARDDVTGGRREANAGTSGLWLTAQREPLARARGPAFRFELFQMRED